MRHELRSGIYVGGTTLYSILILYPRLRRLGPTIQSAVEDALSAVEGPVARTSLVVLLSTGVALTLMRHDLASLPTSAWGWDIIIGFIATLGWVAVIGLGLPTFARQQNLAKGLASRAPTPEKSQQMQLLSATLDNLKTVAHVSILIALATMIVARFL